MAQIPDVPRTQNYQSPLDTSEQDVYRIRLDYETQINESFTLRNKFYVTDLQWLSEGTLINGTFDHPLVGTLSNSALCRFWMIIKNFMGTKQKRF